MLLDHAAEKGAEVLRGVRVRDVAFDGDRAVGVRIVGDDSADRTIAARVIVDAAGQQGLLSGRVAGRRPSPDMRKASIWGHYRGSRREIIEDGGVAATLDLQLSNRVALKSVTAFRQWNHEHIGADPDFGPADLFVLNEPADIDNFSEEVSFTVVKGATNLLLGVYYATEDYTGWRSAETGSDADNYLNSLISASLGATTRMRPWKPGSRESHQATEEPTMAPPTTTTS